jgi:hypothetical protein
MNETHFLTFGLLICDDDLGKYFRYSEFKTEVFAWHTFYKYYSGFGNSIHQPGAPKVPG